MKNRRNDLRVAPHSPSVGSFFFSATFSGSLLEPSFRITLFRLEACVAFSSVSNDWMLMGEGYIQMDKGGPYLHGASELTVFRLVATVKYIEGETWWCRCRASLEPTVWESCFRRNSDTAKGQRNPYFPPVLNTAISVLQRNDMQLALCICGFRILGYNQPQIKNIWKVTLLLTGTM